MAEPTFSPRMADFLQGRAGAAYAPVMSEFTTPGDLQRERISNALGWDVGRPVQEFARRALTYLPLATRAGVGGRPVTASPRPAAPTPEGPWTPGYHDAWLASRSSAAPQRVAPQINQDRRWGRTEPDLSDYLPRPYGNVPPLQWGVGVAGMGGAGRVAYDSIVHGLPPDESLRRWIGLPPHSQANE
jgi:hypothetical protein